ncbi:hypothetical protein [Pyrobaculum neutrophilum]|uniref:Uncharacterized protein n=1 Tax=Pyrobaculum neutrophilum (strain DSM 2338 / JCM 9278 / NBRC 100436 / V24Sta) TaxID=444157 RepID=B1YCX2_PYRNV|nr:hypothetical protein [Pyrobaculum neutrophilum]ACB39635.1 conserved hypothetical protein [Pyrobaculum neutrophilum V24Sta]
MECEDTKKILERLDEIEILIRNLLEEVRELKRGRAVQAPRGLVEVLREKKFMPVSEVKSRQALREAMERGLVLVLRDEGANRDVVVLKEAARALLDKLPISVKDSEKLPSRDYELLQILNRLGYVLLKGGQYIKTDLAEEFYI